MYYAATRRISHSGKAASQDLRVVSNRDLSDAMAERKEKGATYPANGPVLRRPHPRSLFRFAPAATRWNC
jgi:hypothetical protein